MCALCEGRAIFSVGVAITTRGERNDHLIRLIGQVPPDVLWSLAWQSDLPVPPEMLSLAEKPNGNVVVSSGGASRGRNDAVAGLTYSVDWLIFPNDDSWYPTEFWDVLSSQCPADGQVLAWRVWHSDDGAIVGREGLESWSRGGTTARRVLVAAHEPSVAISAKLFHLLGGFEVTIGTGSPGSVQSGEGSDLVARSLYYTSIVDVSPVLRTFEPYRRTAVEHTVKRRRYALGPAYVLGRHSRLPGRKRALTRYVFASGVRYRSVRMLIDMYFAYREGAGRGRDDSTKLRVL